VKIDTPEQRARDKAAADFHEHLEGCKRCAGHPVDLCPVGEGFIRAAFSPYSEKEMGR
jgi:hypothetical protein